MPRLNINEPPEKRCRICEINKPLDAFYKHKETRDGRDSYCKTCAKIKSLQRQRRHPEKAKADVARWRKDNPDKVKAYGAKWRKTHPDKVRATTVKWRKAHPEKYKEYQIKYGNIHRLKIQNRKKLWKEANSKAIKIKDAAWRRANNELVKSYCAKYRAQKRCALIENVDYKIVYKRDQGRCHLCGRKVKMAAWHLDHLIPLSKGGEHSYRNVAVACPHCNMSKSAGRLPSQLRLFG